MPVNADRMLPVMWRDTGDEPLLLSAGVNILVLTQWQDVGVLMRQAMLDWTGAERGQ